MNLDDAKRQTVDAFDALRKTIQPWRDMNPSCSVAMGGDSDCGQWSVVFENNAWLVFVGERGERIGLSTFSNPWDAVSYAGYRATSGLKPHIPFPVIYPKILL